MLDQAVICTNCGVKAGEGHHYCSACGAKITSGATHCISCGSPTPYYRERSTRPKSKILAGVLGLLLGEIGIHRFYLGYIGIGVIQIILTFITGGIAGVWGFIEGILILSGTVITTDHSGRPLR